MRRVAHLQSQHPQLEHPQNQHLQCSVLSSSTLIFSTSSTNTLISITLRTSTSSACTLNPSTLGTSSSSARAPTTNTPKVYCYLRGSAEGYDGDCEDDCGEGDGTCHAIEGRGVAWDTPDGAGPEGGGVPEEREMGGDQETSIG
ncbi:unnamed protein product, partial [Closterium sp. NIES-53]